jgi:hypothetical protein
MPEMAYSSYADYMSASDWPAFSRLDEAGQRAFWNVLGEREVSMPPRIAIVVRGGVVQEVASDTADVLSKLLDIDSINEGESPGPIATARCRDQRSEKL